MCFGPEAPSLWLTMSDPERSAQGELTSDQCIINDQNFFIRGQILIPVLDGPGPFIWLVWISLSKDSFLRTCELWEIEGREAEPPYFGWLQTALPYEPSTLNLKAHVQTMPIGQRPTIFLEPEDHPLSREQRHGITLARVQEIAEACFHGGLLRNS